jgi:hypothetical protein
MTDFITDCNHDWKIPTAEFHPSDGIGLSYQKYVALCGWKTSRLFWLQHVAGFCTYQG